MRGDMRKKSLKQSIACQFIKSIDQNQFRFYLNNYFQNTSIYSIIDKKIY